MTAHLLRMGEKRKRKMMIVCVCVREKKCVNKMWNFSMGSNLCLRTNATVLSFTIRSAVFFSIICSSFSSFFSSFPCTVDSPLHLCCSCLGNMILLR